MNHSARSLKLELLLELCLVVASALHGLLIWSKWLCWYRRVHVTKPLAMLPLILVEQFISHRLSH